MEVEFLRKCRVCGLEAHTKEELRLFIKGPNGNKYGRENICFDCDKKNRKKYREKIRQNIKNGFMEGYCRKYGNRFCVVKNGIFHTRARVLMEECLNRELMDNEDVHHINKDTLDDRIENLELMTKSDHAKHHHLKGDNALSATIKYRENRHQYYMNVTRKKRKKYRNMEADQ